MPTFATALRTHPAKAARAPTFLILTAARSGEVPGARWDEIEWEGEDGAVWTVPMEGMKARRPHRVPLSEAAVPVLRPLTDAGRAARLFPGQPIDAATGGSKALSITALTCACGGWGLAATVHNVVTDTYEFPAMFGAPTAKGRTPRALCIHTLARQGLAAASRLFEGPIAGLPRGGAPRPGTEGDRWLDYIERAVATMLARMTHPLAGAFVGVHRTFLGGGGTRLEKRMLGRGYGVVRLHDPDAKAEPMPGLAIAEGLETALAVAVRYGWARVWAALDAGRMAAFPGDAATGERDAPLARWALPDTEALTVFADHDAKGAGQRAAAGVVRRWRAGGREAEAFASPIEGEDVADLHARMDARMDARMAERAGADR